MRPPVETQMKRMSRSGQLRSTSAMRLFISRVMYTPRATVDVAEGEAGLSDGRVVEDRCEARRIGHYGAIEQCLIAVREADQIDVPFEIGRFGIKMPEHALDLSLEPFHGHAATALPVHICCALPR
jgi:hypothetical protein